MPDLTPVEARTFLAALEALSKTHGIALVSDGNAMALIKADPEGFYNFSEGNFKDGSVTFDQIAWTEQQR